MTQFLPPNLLALFAPRDPIPYLPPLEKLPHEKHHNQPYCGIAPYIREFEVSTRRHGHTGGLGLCMGAGCTWTSALQHFNSVPIIILFSILFSAFVCVIYFFFNYTCISGICVQTCEHRDNLRGSDLFPPCGLRKSS